MKLGFQINDFKWRGGAKRMGPTLAHMGQAAEAAGFDSIAVMDHVWQSSYMGGAEGPVLECYATLSYLAAATRRIKLMALATPPNYRYPGMLAKTVTTLDVLSGGRAWLGLGAGDYEEEARGLGIPYPSTSERFEMLEETIEICLRMWHGDQGDERPFAGRHAHLERPLNLPQNLSRPHPPILIAGAGEQKTLRLVARYGNACNLPPSPEIPRKLDVLRRHCEAEGADYDAIEKTGAFRFDVGSDAKVEELIGQLRWLAGLGIQTVFGWVIDADQITPIETMSRDVIPAIADLRTVQFEGRQNMTALHLTRRNLLTASAATLAGLGLSHGVNRGTLAQEATPAASPTAQQMDRAALEGMIQFQHPEKVYDYLPGFTSEENIAAFYATDVATYREIKAMFAANARAAAEELLADPDFAARVDRLPFQAGQSVVVIGESTTDDFQSWFEILRHVLDLRRPQDGITLNNLAVSGQTTTQALARFPYVLFSQPHWLLIMFGANDAMRHGLEPTKPRVSNEETLKNLNELRHQAETQSEANLVWITPTPVNEEKVRADPSTAEFQYSIANDDVLPTIAALRDQFDPVVDLEPVFGVPADPAFVPNDGVHPAIPGHQAIVRAVVERLTS